MWITKKSRIRTLKQKKSKAKYEVAKFILIDQFFNHLKNIFFKKYFFLRHIKLKTSL